MRMDRQLDTRGDESGVKHQLTRLGKEVVGISARGFFLYFFFLSHRLLFHGETGLTVELPAGDVCNDRSSS